jgi:hypothetical protein
MEEDSMAFFFEEARDSAHYLLPFDLLSILTNFSKGLAENIQNNKKILWLNLRGNSISDEGKISIANFIRLP